MKQAPTEEFKALFRYRCESARFQKHTCVRQCCKQRITKSAVMQSMTTYLHSIQYIWAQIQNYHRQMTTLSSRQHTLITFWRTMTIYKPSNTTD